MSPYKGKTGARRVWNALHISFSGLRAAWVHEDAFRQEALLAVVLIPTALFMPVSAAAKAILVASVLFVLVTELLNSSIEALTDRVSLETHELAKRAKDLGSAAVMLSLITLVAVWGLVLLG